MQSRKSFKLFLSLLLTVSMILGPIQPSLALATGSENPTNLENSQVEQQKDTENSTDLENSQVEQQEDSVNNNPTNDRQVKISLVYMNDVHGRISYNKRNSQIGYGRIKSYYDSISGHKLLLDVGDASQGTVEVNLKEGEPAFKLMDLIGVDASVLGNHEFDFSYERLLENMKSYDKDKILGSNIIRDSDGIRPFDNLIIKEFDGVKVGIFGIDTPETKYKAKPTNTEGLTFEKPLVTAKAKVQELKDKGADIIVALVHLGTDGSTLEDERGDYLLENVDGIDLLLDGHSHTIGSRKIGNGYYAQAAKYSELLGEATLLYNKDTKQVTVDNKFHHVYTQEKLDKNRSNPYYDEFYSNMGEDLTNLVPDPQVEKYISDLQEEIEPIKNEVIGHSDFKLEGERNQVRTRQTNLSTIIADAMRKASNADVALTNGGGIRDSIDAGDITKGEVLTVLPFGNTVTVIETSGQKIYEALKHGTSDYPNPKGAYPQVSGITYDILVNSENKMEDIVNIKVGDQALDLNKTYSLATNDFMAVGGDGYTMFFGAHQIALLEGMAEIVMDYINDISPIKLKDESVKVTNILTDISQVTPEPQPSPEPNIEPKPSLDPKIEPKPGSDPKTEPKPGTSVSIPKALEQSSKTWTLDSKDDLVFKSDGKFEELVEVLLDGKEIKPEVTRGSTIVTLKAKDLQELPVGNHTLRMVFENRETYGKSNVDFTFEVAANSQTVQVKENKLAADSQSAKSQEIKVSSKSPQTSDKHILPYVLLLGLASASLIIVKKKEKVKK